MATKAQSVQFLLSPTPAYASGKAYFYAAGSSTFKTIWLDRNKAATAANPYDLSVNGTAALFAEGIYRVVIKDASGVVKFDQDGLEFGKSDDAPGYYLSDYPDLPAAVAAIGANPATLYYDADVTLSGNLTIPANIELFPLNGATIEHGTYTLTYVSDTSRWPLTQIFNGTGAVSGLKESRPQWFGAVGNGTTDDTAAVLRAFNAGPLYLTDGATFAVSSITVANAKAKGPGGFKHLPANDNVMIYCTGDCEFDGVKFNGDWQNAALSTPPDRRILIEALTPTGTLTVNRCDFVNSHSRAIQAGGSLKVTNNTFKHGAPHNGLSGGLERVTSYINATPVDVIPDDAAVEISGNTLIGDAQVQQDYWKNPGGVAINKGLSSRYKTVSITNNTFLYVGQSGGDGNVLGAIDTYDGVDSVTISGNTIRGYSYAAVKVQNSNNATITGNNISDGFASADSTVLGQAYGIMLVEKIRTDTTERSYGTISGNTINGAQYKGILCSLDHVAITGNTVSNVTTGGSASAVGIESTGAYCTISGNTLKETANNAIVSTGSGTTITGNTAIFSSGAGILFSGAGVNVTGNIVEKTGTIAATGIRSNGPLSASNVASNTIINSTYGVDIRDTSGIVSGVRVGTNAYSGVTNPVNNAAGEGVSVAFTYSYARITYDAPSIASGATVTTTATVPGAAVADLGVTVGVSSTNGVIVSGYVSAADTVTIVLYNPTAAPVDIASKFYHISVAKI